MMQNAGGRNQNIRLAGPTVASRHAPIAIRKLTTGDFRVEANALVDAETAHDAFNVVLNLPAGGVAHAPIGIESKGVTVKVRWNIASNAGIGIVAPRTAGLAGLLVDHNVAIAGGLQLDGRHDAGEPGADND